MLIYSNRVAAERLLELRESRHFTQAEMGEELNKRIGRNGDCNRDSQKGLSLDFPNGYQTVAQLEQQSRSVTARIAFAYSEIFDVSLDYIFGRIDTKWPEFKDIKKATGLSDLAVEAIKVLRNEIIKSVKN